MSWYEVPNEDDGQPFPVPEAPFEGPEPDDFEDGVLGPCGCTDYHMADCGSGGAWLAEPDFDPDTWYEDEVLEGHFGPF